MAQFIHKKRVYAGSQSFSERITFDNTNTKLSANNVQDAVKEVDTKIDTETTDRDVAVITALTEAKEYTDENINDRLGGYKFVVMSEEEYQALTTKDPNTFYFRPKE